jgi:YHYH protein
VRWPDARFSIQTIGDRRVLTGNALPVGQTTSSFPIARSDPAFAIDPNPNPILAQTLTFALPLQPTPAADAGCVPMGVIGVAVNGVPIFNALDAAGRDAVAHEVQDRCHGHPQGAGIYHHHNLSRCAQSTDGATSHSPLVGYIADGFALYGKRGEGGALLTNADLDECHGHSHTITVNGAQFAQYHYHATTEYPYTIGCFKGTPVVIR